MHRRRLVGVLFAVLGLTTLGLAGPAGGFGPRPGAPGVEPGPNIIIPGEPGPPTNPGATPGDGQVTVSWSPPSNDGGAPIVGYWVTVPDHVGCSTNGAGRSCTVTGLTNGTEYTFTIIASNGVEEGPGVTIKATPRGTGAPGVPTGLGATPGDRQVAVTWSAPASEGSSPITGYEVTADPGGAACVPVPATGTACTVGGLTNGTEYTLTVVASNAVGPGPGATVEATPRTVPGGPENVAAVAGTRRATVSWSPPGSDGGAAITAYMVTSNPDGRTCSTDGSGGSCVVPSLSDATPYTFTVRATNAAGPGDVSAASNTVTPTASSVSCVPGSAGSSESIQPGATVACSFTAGSGAAFTGWTATGFTPGSSSEAARCFVAGGAGPGSISASYTDDEGAHAVNFSYVITLAPTVPGKPTGVIAVPDSGSALVSWTAPADGGSPITGYLVTASPGAKHCTPTSATATSCTVEELADGTYSFSVVATNQVGDGAPSDPSAPALIDTHAPSVMAPSVAFRTGQSLSGTAVPVRVSWSGSDALSGIAAFGLELATSGTSVPQPLSPATRTTLDRTLAAGTPTYRFQVRATDIVGNESNWTRGPLLTLSLVQDRSATYTGTWKKSTTSSASGGTLRYTTAKNAAVSITFSGRAIAWVAPKGTTRGTAKVYVDGKAVGNVSLNGSSAARVLVFARYWPAVGRHTLRIVCLRTAGHPRIDLDAFVVIR